MIASSPVREGAAAARKRNRPKAQCGLSSSWSSAADPFSKRRDHGATCSPPTHGRDRHGIAAAAVASTAAVSPFSGRPALSASNNIGCGDSDMPLASPFLELETVAEEATNDSVTNGANDGGNIFNLLQSSATSPVSFAASDSSSVRVNLGDGGSTNSFQHCHCGNAVKILGAVRGPIEGVVAQDAGWEDCLPSASKRARLDRFEGPHRTFSSSSGGHYMVDGDGVVAPPPVVHTASEEYHRPAKKVGISLKMNIVKPHEGLCCHVCSAVAESADDNVNDGNIDTPAAFDGLHQQGRQVTAEAKAVVGPQSHSLLAYFQPMNGKQRHCLTSRQRDSDPRLSQLHAAAHTSAPGLAPCQYCDRLTCVSCSRRCEACRRFFCTFCTKVDYESSVMERILCFECDELYVVGARRWENNVDGDCDMMDV